MSQPRFSRGTNGTATAVMGTVLLCVGGAWNGCKKAAPEVGGAAAAGTGTGVVGEARDPDREREKRDPAKPGSGAASADGPADNVAPPGVDLSALGEFEKKVFFRVVNNEASVCGKAH